jgi:4-aminobutyrate--pyruvate transaminase
MAALELVADKATRTPFPAALKVGAKLAARAQEHGLFVRAIGDAVVMAPPLIITRNEIEDLLARLGRALAETEQFVRQHAV